MMSEDHLQVLERFRVSHQRSSFVNHEHDLLVRLFRTLIDQRNQ